MGSKTISLSETAYRRLRAQKREAGDSFSQIVLRARWEDESVTGEELLKMWREEPPFFTEEELSAVELAKREQPEAKDKWSGR